MELALAYRQCAPMPYEYIKFSHHITKWNSACGQRQSSIVLQYTKQAITTKWNIKSTGVQQSSFKILKYIKWATIHKMEQSWCTGRAIIPKYKTGHYSQNGTILVYRQGSIPFEHTKQAATTININIGVPAAELSTINVNNIHLLSQNGTIPLYRQGSIPLKMVYEMDHTIPSITPTNTKALEVLYR